MNKNRLLLVGLVIAILIAVMSGVLLITTQVNQPEPFGPTAPQSQPAAGSCTLDFSVDAPTPTPLIVCNGACTTDTQCPTGMTCTSGACRNPSCTGESSCVCPSSTPTPTPSPTPSPTPPTACNSACVTSQDCPSSMTCSSGVCRNPSCTGESDCVCPTPAPVCNSVCAHNGDCPSDMVCVDGINRCRKQECTEIDTCSCPQPPASTPVPEVPVTPETPQELPKAGITLPTFGLVGVGVGTIIIGILGLLIL